MQVILIYLFLLQVPIVDNPVSETWNAIGLKELSSIINGWTVEESDNILVRYNISHFDKQDDINHARNYAEVTHVLFEGDICVRETFERENKIDRLSRWSNESSVIWSDGPPEMRRAYQIGHSMYPGALAYYGFVFSGFGGLDTGITLLSYGYPQLTDEVLQITLEGDEFSVTYGTVSNTGTYVLKVVVFGAPDKRIRRIETWVKSDGKDEMEGVVKAEFSDWISVKGKLRPKTLIIQPFDNNRSGTRYDFIEMRSSSIEDIAVIPPSQVGDTIADNRVGFVGSVGSTSFVLESFQYTSSTPISGPPLNIEELMSTVVYSSNGVPHQHSESPTQGNLITRVLYSSLIFISASSVGWLAIKRFAK